MVIAVTLIVLIPVSIYIGFGIMMTWTTQYSLFIKARTEKIEELFDITVTDDVKLLHYEDSSILIDIDQRLTLEVEDMLRFLFQRAKINMSSACATVNNIRY